MMAEPKSGCSASAWSRWRSACSSRVTRALGMGGWRGVGNQWRVMWRSSAAPSTGASVAGAATVVVETGTSS